VHPREFRDDFEQGDDIAMVLKHDGDVLRSGKTSWPHSLTGQQKWSDSNIAALVRNLIVNVWGADREEDIEKRAIGKVSYTKIIREVYVYRPVAADEGVKVTASP